jgi:MFS family permease
MKEIQDQVAEDQVLGQQGWAPLFSRGNRWKLFVGMGVAMAQQLNGSESVIYYSPIIFQEAGVADPDDVRGLFLATSLVGFVKFTFVALSACVVDTWGRRPLLIASTTFMAFSLVLVSLAVISGNGALAVSSVCAFVASFSFGIGPVTWLFAAELFSSEVRAKSMSLAVSLNRITSGTIALTFLPMSKALGGAGEYFGFFSAVTALTSVMMFCFVPETKGKTLESLGRDVSDSGSRSNDQLNA